MGEGTQVMLKIGKNPWDMSKIEWAMLEAKAAGAMKDVRVLNNFNELLTIITDAGLEWVLDPIAAMIETAVLVGVGAAGGDMDDYDDIHVKALAMEAIRATLIGHGQAEDMLKEAYFHESE